MPFEMDSTISIHAPREGGDDQLLRCMLFRCISIHAPREGGDPVHASIPMTTRGFQSTPPARGATSV